LRQHSIGFCIISNKEGRRRRRKKKKKKNENTSDLDAVDGAGVARIKLKLGFHIFKRVRNADLNTTSKTTCGRELN